jgi:hypothetical protein
MADANARHTPHGRVALAFARALVAGEFEKAHQMLSPPLRDEFPPARLKQEYQDMFSYAGETGATDFDVIGASQEWLEKESDVGWAYASISGPNRVIGGAWIEAVAVIVEDNDGQMLIRGSYGAARDPRPVRSQSGRGRRL